VDVIEGYTHFPSEGFEKYIETFYPLAVDLLGRDLSPEIRLSVQSLLRRIGEARLGVSFEQMPSSPSARSRSSISQNYWRKTSRGH
jgi:brefeldin A-inhibited guanine nucleotide-exchange protein